MKKLLLNSIIFSISIIQVTCGMENRLLPAAAFASSGFIGYAGYKYLKQNNPQKLENIKSALLIASQSSGAVLATGAAALLGIAASGYTRAFWLGYFEYPPMKYQCTFEFQANPIFHRLKNISLLFAFPAMSATCGFLASKLAHSAKTNIKNYNKN